MVIDLGTTSAALKRAAHTPTQAYLAACSSLQVAADVALAAIATQQNRKLKATVSVQLERCATSALAAARGLSGEAIETVAPLPGAVTLSGPFGPYQAAIDAAIAPPLPECCGYNLADVERCVADAAWLRARAADASSFVVVGIRTGGAYLAPAWAAALVSAGAEATFTTVRPFRAPGIGFHSSEMARVKELLAAAPGAHLVIVDDFPDTGATARGFVETLATDGIKLWFAAVGHVFAVEPPAKLRPIRRAAALAPRTKKPLWQLLLPDARDAFRARLESEAPGCLPDLETIAVTVHCDTIEARYGRDAPWRPWNDPVLATGRRLVNPRKTPFVVSDAAGHLLLHARFIGEAPFGTVEFARAERTRSGPEKAWFVDGYRIAVHITALRSVGSILSAGDASQRHTLLNACADRLKCDSSEGWAMGLTRAKPRFVGTAIRRAIGELEKRFGMSLPVPGRLDPVLDREIPLPIASGRVHRSALPYAHGDWHWQVDGQGALVRFHREAGWGGLASLELELASFALEHAIARGELATMTARAGLDGALADVVAHLPAAALLRLETLVRSVRFIDAPGRELLKYDLSEMWAALSRLSRDCDA